MSLTAEKLARIPEEYKTFLEMLWPVVRSQEDGSVIRVSGIPFWMIANRVSERHGYSERQVKELAENLAGKGWIESDSLGFYVPHGQGIEVLRAMFQPSKRPKVPALPEL